MSMSYEQAVEYLYNQLPQFQLVGAQAYKPGLQTTLEFSSHLGNPHEKFACIHVGGTNGKGSTSSMLYSVLREAGFRVGLYTSPHLKDFRERVVVDSQMIPQQDVCGFVEGNKDTIERLCPSFFEVTTLMAFDYFARSGVDIAVVEVGLGGRLDSTNIVTPILSVITNIAMDHTAILGNTVREIATEKAGIIKSGVPVVIGESCAESDTVFIQRAKECGSSLLFADKCYRASRDLSLGGEFLVQSLFDGAATRIAMPLSGEYQTRNLCTALAALDVLAQMDSRITGDVVLRGLSLATIRGRWEVLGERPLVVCDTGHNVAGVEYIAKQLSEMNYERLYVVLGVVGDKDVSAILALLPVEAYYIFTQAHIPRALAAVELCEKAAVYGLRGEVVGSVAGAVERARSLANEGDMIFIGGSTFTVAEAL